jgi:hypothetical protein
MNVLRNDARPLPIGVHRSVRGDARSNRRHGRFILHLALLTLLVGAMGCIPDLDHIWTDSPRAYHFGLVIASWLLIGYYITLAGGYLYWMGVRTSQAQTSGVTDG